MIGQAGVFLLMLGIVGAFFTLICALDEMIERSKR